MTTRRGRVLRSSSAFTLLFALAIAGGGCPGSAAPDIPEVGVQTGALGVHIKKPVADVKKLEYTITRSGQFYRKGAFVIDKLENNFSAVVGGIEANSGYLLNMKAVAPLPDSDKPSKCEGAAPFDVEVGETTVVSLTLHCEGYEEKTPVERCPIVSSVRVLPSEAPIGKCVILKAIANVIGTLRTPLHYRWKSSSGKLQNDEPHVAKLECTETGISTVTVDLETTDSECANDSVAIHVTCTSGDTRSHRHAEMGAAGSAPKH